MDENRMRRSNEETEIDLVELFHVLLKKWWLLLAVCITCGAIAYAGTKLIIKPTYKSSASLYILNKTTSVTSVADLQIGTALSNDFSVIAKSRPVIDMSIEQIEKESGKKFTRSYILKSLTVTNKDNTRILEISSVCENPEDACAIAQAVADSTAKRMAEITMSTGPTSVEKAEVNRNPVGPHAGKNAVIGALLGFVLVAGIIIILHLVNDSIKTEEDIENYLGVPTLVVIPVEKGRDNKKAELKAQREASASRKSSSKKK